MASQALKNSVRISGGVRRICVPCLVCISSMASAFSFCHCTHQRTKVSVAAERIASCCCGVSAAHTSVLKMSSVGEVIFNTEVWAALTTQQQDEIRSAATETVVR